MGTTGQNRWAQRTGVIEVRPEFDLLRHLPRHLLLADLRKQLLLHLCDNAKQHYEGLSAGLKALDPSLSRQTVSRLKAKLRLVDDAHHLLEHLTPESATVFCDEIADAMPKSGSTCPDPAVVSGSSSGDGAEAGASSSADSNTNESLGHIVNAATIDEWSGVSSVDTECQTDLALDTLMLWYFGSWTLAHPQQEAVKHDDDE